MQTDGTFRRWSWSDSSWFSPKTAEYWYALWLTLLRGSHCMSVCGSFLEVKWTFLLQMCCHIPDPFHLLGNSKGNRTETEKNTSFPIFHTRHNFINVLHFNNTQNSLTWNWDNLFQSSSNSICNQVLHPNSTHCYQIPTFPRTSASHSNTLGSPGWGSGSKLILLFDHNRH